MNTKNLSSISKNSKTHSPLKKYRAQLLLHCVIVLFIFTRSPNSYAIENNLQLPALGENSAGLISITEEYNRGHMALRYFRAVLPLSNDPFIRIYLQSLLQKIVTFSELPNKRLELLVLENPTLNAFAAPGGIVGVHTGIFLIAENEHQLASILSHELAHLSQRHYARGVQQSKKSIAVTMAGFIAGLMLASAGEGDAAMAGILLSQATVRDSSLKFSREMEKEADRIGLQTLIKADFDPDAMPTMFEIMMKSARYNTKVPEFLMSHPVTESRITDTASRVQKLPKQRYSNSEDYQLIRARVMMFYEERPEQAVKRFEEALKEPNKMSELTARYGHVLALTKTKQIKEAQESLKQLKLITHNTAAIVIAEADIAAASGDFKTAQKLLSDALVHTPNNHPINVRYAEILMEAGEYEKCESILLAHVKNYADNDYVWYLLAEVHGLAGHILDVHKARAEYFILKGLYKKAEIQLRNALQLIDKEDFQGKAKVEQRLLDLKKLTIEAEEFQ